MFILASPSSQLQQIWQLSHALHWVPVCKQLRCWRLVCRLDGRLTGTSRLAGSGKTAAFSLPILERLLYRNKRMAATYALVLTPTRELAVQVQW